MNDINWRNINDDFSIYELANSDRDILCKNEEGTIWTSKCKYVDGFEDKSTRQYVDYYAYLN